MSRCGSLLLMAFGIDSGRCSRSDAQRKIDLAPTINR